MEYFLAGIVITTFVFLLIQSFKQMGEDEEREIRWQKAVSDYLKEVDDRLKKLENKYEKLYN